MVYSKILLTQDWSVSDSQRLADTPRLCQSCFVQSLKYLHLDLHTERANPCLSEEQESC